MGPGIAVSCPAHTRRGALRSPLAAATQSPLPPICPPADTGPAPSQLAADARSLTLAEFGHYLRTINNRDGWPYEDTTINAYVFRVRLKESPRATPKASVRPDHRPGCASRTPARPRRG